jgi:hypothetical protein
MVVKSVVIQPLPRVATSRTEGSLRKRNFIPTTPNKDKGLQGIPHRQARGGTRAEAQATTRIRTRSKTRSRAGTKTRNTTRSNTVSALSA